MFRSHLQLRTALHLRRICAGLLLSEIAALAAPVNDNFADRISLTGTPLSVLGTTVGGTLEPDEPPTYHVLSTVWYEWVAPADGQVRLRVDGSPYYLVAYIYSGNQLGQLRLAGFFSSNYEGNIDVQRGRI